MAVGTLRAQDPNWQLDRRGYQYSLTVVASLKLQGVLSSDANDKIAAFVGSSVRGLAAPEIFIDVTGAHVAFLQIYSHAVSGDMVTFKVYDASADRVYEAVNTLTFQSNISVGANTAPYVITDNYGPTDIILSADTLAENNPEDAVIANLSSVSQNATQSFVYSLAPGGGDDNAAFSVVGEELRAAISFDYETKNEYTIRLRSADTTSEYVEKDFTLTITDENDPPVAINLSIAAVPENTLSGVQVAVLNSADPDEMDSHTYHLVSGDGDQHNDYFALSDDRLLVAVPFDFEAQATCLILLESRDAAGQAYRQPTTITVEDVNEAPTDITLSQSTIREGFPVGEVVADLQAEDEDAQETHTYQLIAGKETFAIQGDQLLLLVPVNYEQQNAFFATVEVTDKGGLTYRKRLVIPVENENDAPTATTLSSLSIREDLAIGVLIGDFITQDEDFSDRFVYELVPGHTDHEAFILSGSSLIGNTRFNYEAKKSYTLHVLTRDAGGSSLESTISLAVADVNEAPTDLVLSGTSIGSQSPIGTAIGTLATADEDEEDSHAYALIGGAGADDNAFFLVEDSTLRLLRSLDGEGTRYSLRLAVLDRLGASFEKSFSIVVNQEDPVAASLALSNWQIAENSPINSVVGTLSLLDDTLSQPVAYQIMAGGDTFSLVGDALYTNMPLDYEEQVFRALTVRATGDAGRQTSQDLVVVLTDVNEAPSRLTFVGGSVREDVPANTEIGHFFADDPDYTDHAGNLRIELVAAAPGNDNAYFFIENGVLRNRIPLDYETKSTYALQVVVADDGTLSHQQSFVVEVEDVVEPPAQLMLSNSFVKENALEGTLVGEFSADALPSDASFWYALVPGPDANDNEHFYISQAHLLTKRIFDYETQSSYTINVQVKDGLGGTLVQRFVIGIQDENDPPLSLRLSALSLPENNRVGAVIGTFSVEDEDSGIAMTTYRIFSTTDLTAFSIVANQLRANRSFDYETQATYALQIMSQDEAGYQLTQYFTIHIENVNDPPSDIVLAPAVVVENNGMNSPITTIRAIDQDLGADVAYTYALVAGTGDEDNALFSIDDDSLRALVVLNYEEKKTYKIRLKATGAEGLSIEKSLDLPVQDANDLPSTIRAEWRILREDLPVGSFLGSVSAQDEDAGNLFFYQLGEGAGLRQRFEMRGFELYLLQALDFEKESSYELPIRVMDQYGGVLEVLFQLDVVDVNEPPVFLPADLRIVENVPEGAVVGTVSARDPDNDQRISYSIMPAEDTVRVLEKFGIDEETGEIFVLSGNFLDYETKNTHKLLIKAEDDGSPPLASVQYHTIHVLDEPEKVLPANLVLTPNNDGINDFWVIRGLEEHYKDLSLTIFSSFGQILFQSKNYDNTWDGTYKGKVLPSGVYYYLLESPSREIRYKGSLSIIN